MNVDTGSVSSSRLGIVDSHTPLARSLILALLNGISVMDFLRTTKTRA